MRACILSGTFNPIHNGHIYMAEYALKNFDINKILFIPAYIPPQKEFDPKLSVHKYKMVELATMNNKNFEVSDIEYKLGGKSYSYITIQELYKNYSIDGKINFIIGTDAFEKLDSWYESEKLRQIVEFIVFVRENNYVDGKYDFMREKGYSFKFAQMPYNNISSTEIRQKIKTKQSISGLVPELVERYINDNDLYKD